MLDKHIDHVIVGNSYLSYFLGLKTLNENKSTLIVNDSRFMFGGPFQSRLTEIDLSIIKELGKKYDIKSFINIDQYISLNPYNIHVDDTIVRLGDIPSRNFREIVRKFYGGIVVNGRNDRLLRQNCDLNANDFDQEFKNICDRLVCDVIKYPSIKYFDLSTFINHSTKIIRDLFDYVSDALFDQKSSIGDAWHVRCLLYVLGGIYHDNFSFSMSKFELFHLVMCFLSASYKLDYESFNKSLNDEFVSKGGKYRQVMVDKWLFDKNRPWAIMLSSFEGIVMPKEISFLGPRPLVMPVDITPKGTHYNIVQFSWKIDSAETLLPREGISCFVQSEKIGTEIPVFWSEIHDDNLNIYVYLLSCEGRKVEFYADRLRREIIKGLNKTYCIEEKDIKSQKIIELGDISLAGTARSGFFEQPSSVKINVLDSSDITDKKVVSDVDYWGQFSQFPLGKSSMLLELCLS